MSKQPWYLMHAETITQNVLGQVIGLGILLAFQVDFHTAWKMEVVFFVASYIRSYFVRRFFDRVTNG